MKNLIILTFTLFLMINCSSGPVYQEFPDTASPTEELVKLETEINDARKAQAHMLSPDNFAEADEALEDAREGMMDQDSAKSILHDIAKSRAYLKRALNFTSLARTNLYEVISARDQAIKADAQNLAKEEFADADEELLVITSDIEKNQLQSAIKDGAELQEKYLEIELSSIKRKNLDPAKELINVAEREGAEDYAPRSLAKAKKEVADFEAFLTANRHEESEIRKYRVTTDRSANHLLKITRDAKSGKMLTSEDMALRLEDEQDLVASKQDQLDKNTQRLENLSAANTGFENDRVLNERYESARKEFNSQEAEVYKQGNTLAIRLKGLEFPVSQSQLRGENYPLLAKVQKVLSEFEESKIVIEGHTDSVGNKEANQTLSFNRAEAVRKYLISNQRGQALDIEAVGHGFQKPLASNRTAEGRAQNRRVDVLITSPN